MTDLFASNDIELWRAMLSEYSHLLAERAAQSRNCGGLKELDDWYQNDFPGQLSTRIPKHITKDEISKVMKWKLMRGKFRPRLQQMIEANSDEDVRKWSEEAFRRLPHSLERAAIGLMNLKGVGPATASAILATADPDSVPFMADESVLAIPKLEPIQYTLRYYLRYAAKIRDCCARLHNAGDD